MKSMNKPTKIFFGAGLVILLGLALVHSSQALAQGGVWETKAPMPNIKGTGFAGVIDGKLHVGGEEALRPGIQSTRSTTNMTRGRIRGHSVRRSPLRAAANRPSSTGRSMLSAAHSVSTPGSMSPISWRPTIRTPIHGRSWPPCLRQGSRMQRPRSMENFS